MTAETNLLIVGNYGAKLIGQRLEVWFNFARDLDRDNHNYHTGCATSIRLDGKEELDPFYAELPWLYMSHDLEKRCMQIDQVQFWDEQGITPISLPINLIDLPYELQSQSNDGDVVSIHIASAPFELDLGKGYACYRFHREIALHATSDILTEEVSVQPMDVTGNAIIPNFSVRYFSYIAWRASVPNYYWNPDTPNYFAVGYSKGPGPYPGYGFASNVATQCLNHPVSDYLFPEQAGNTFSWTLAPCKGATCWHLFMRHEKGNFQSRISNSWEALKEQARGRIVHV
jgi:hypothetical protein